MLPLEVNNMEQVYFQTTWITYGCSIKTKNIENINGCPWK
jgi:hypothetical protein